MTIRVALHHTTRYRYDRPVILSPQVVRLRPAPHCRTPIEAYSLRISPKQHFINWQQDPFGNYQARLVFPEPSDELSVEVDLVAEMTVINPFDFFLDEHAEHFPFEYPPALRRDLAPYLARGSHGSKFTDLAELARVKDAVAGRRTIDVLVDLNRRVQQKVHYDIRMEPGVFEPEETLERGHGSCRDFAWLLVQLLRNLGLAARFVSGYSIQLKADEKPVVGPAGVESDATDLHAWAEVFLPGAGWVGLDATSGLLAGEGHIPLACTPDPSGAAPITGSFDWHKRHEDDKVKESFEFAMKVMRVREEPRVTLPYSEDTWRAIDSLGKAVDAALEAGDVRLTMGGEPTFVAGDDPEGDEWNTAALGPTKRKYASDLLRRLYPRFTPGALVHEGLGKWYPGEPLPRWALSCYFRKDGVPVWRDPLLFEGEQKGDNTDRDAHTFVAALAETLGVEARLAHPAYEDTWYYLWRERRLPVNVDPFDAKLEDELERARLARVFEQGLAKIVGYALPLRRVSGPTGPAWTSGNWFVRPERLYLLPGDSPMGLRLPLDGLPWVAKADYPHLYERDPFAPTDPLPPRSNLGRRATTIERQTDRGPRNPAAGDFAASSGRRAGSETAPRRFESDPFVVRTALCVEPRDGILHVFMPPTETAEDYLDLCAAIEDTAAAQGKKVRIEGYHPPPDPRLNRMQITPDPGVIEVNTVPSRSWSELVDSTTFLYEEARQSGLRPEKFMIDGRHVGAGGGNHVVLGGPTPADSPMLRRPDLLRSLLAYWLNHPSISFLFSGLFVGPTSQAPRVDEARHDSLVRARHRVSYARSAERRLRSPLAGRSNLPQPPGRRDRQHAPHRVLHRQAVQPRQRRRASGPGRAARLRDAAARTHEPHPAAAGARARRVVLENSLPRVSGSMGHRAARPVLAARISCRMTSKTCSAISRARDSGSSATGSRRTASFAFRSWDRSKRAEGSSSSSGKPSSPGMCSAKRPAAAATCATSTRRSSASRSKCAA